MKMLFYDLETTGVDNRKHSITQIAGILVEERKVLLEFNLKLRPHPKAKIEPEALAKQNRTLEEIMAYPDQAVVFKEFSSLLSKVVNRYDRSDKILLVGFRNSKFDDAFLQKFFELNDDNMFFTIFRSNSLDVSVLATQYLLNRIKYMPSFKLKRVCKELGMYVDTDRLHDAMYDVELTKEAYYIVTGEREEPAMQFYFFHHPESGSIWKEVTPGIHSDPCVEPISFDTYKALLFEYGLEDGPEMISDEIF